MRLPRHREYGEDCRRVEFAIKDATGEWVVSKLGLRDSGRAAAEATTTDTEDEVAMPRRAEADLFGGDSDFSEDEY